MRRGYKVVQRLSALPDDDFVYVANSRYFLPTGGGYGGQASACVERLGGTAIKVPGGASFVLEWQLRAESKLRGEAEKEILYNRPPQILE